jgi:hypothetical protein
VQRGQQKHFRWEIPYQYIVRLEEKPDEKPDGEEGDSGTAKASAMNGESKDQASRASASTSGGLPEMLPLPNRPKTA